MEDTPVVMIAQTIRASLLANATATTLGGLRALSAASQSHNAPLRFGAASKTEMAPNTRSRRIYRLPCLVIDPNFSLPPVEFCLGVAPSQAADRIASVVGDNRALELVDRRVERPQLRKQNPERRLDHRRKVGGGGSLDEFLDVADPFGGDDTELRQMTPQGVHAHRALLDQEFTGLVRHQRGLLVLAPDGDETHVWSRRRSQIAAASAASFLRRLT